MNTLVSEVRYDIAYADAQNAYANLHAAMGLDSFTPDAMRDAPVRDVAARLHDLWSSRELAMKGN
ncbi:hypothetical protein AB5I41_07985 [Sphingomonas sp. MMS24-JH45]